MIKNVYTSEGDFTTIHITRRNGDKHDIFIDTEDLHKIDEINYAVTISWKKNTKSFYAQISTYMGVENGKHKTKTLKLERIIMNAKDDEVVDHRNHNTLDNRKSNLRLTKTDKNTKHRSKKNANNSSGYRNVSWIDGRWVVQLQINGKNTRIKSFTDVHEAGSFAELKRKEIYGEFAGKS